MGGHLTRQLLDVVPSMKVPPKRKGNVQGWLSPRRRTVTPQ